MRKIALAQVIKPDKTWKYRVFKAEAYVCSNCGTKFREYTKNGKYSFTLKVKKGKGFIKA
jgi:hypothetical protein